MRWTRLLAENTTVPTTDYSSSGGCFSLLLKVMLGFCAAGLCLFYLKFKGQLLA